MRRLPMVFWLFLAAGILFGVAGLIDETPLTRALFMIASMAMVVSALLTLIRTHREREQRRRDG